MSKTRSKYDDGRSPDWSFRIVQVGPRWGLMKIGPKRAADELTPWTYDSERDAERGAAFWMTLVKGTPREAVTED
jgi:hypothetical protein